VLSKRHRNLNTLKVANGLKNICYMIVHLKTLRTIVERAFAPAKSKGFLQIKIKHNYMSFEEALGKWLYRKESTKNLADSKETERKCRCLR
jgi:hypothetical protein